MVFVRNTLNFSMYLRTRIHLAIRTAGGTAHVQTYRIKTSQLLFVKGINSWKYLNTLEGEYNKVSRDSDFFKQSFVAHFCFGNSKVGLGSASWQ